MSKEIRDKAKDSLDNDFDIIRQRLKEFNNEEPLEGSTTPNPDRRKIRIDYESIYDIKNHMVHDVDTFGNKVYRRATDSERKDELAKQAREAFGITLNRSLTFMNMIVRLTEEVAKINDEEDSYSNGEDKTINLSSPENKEFTVNELLYTFETVLGKNGVKSNVKPNEESVRLLGDATINIDKPKVIVGYGKIEVLSSEYINTIIDPEFIMGC